METLVAVLLGSVVLFSLLLLVAMVSLRRHWTKLGAGDERHPTPRIRL